jgi:hypothetical protein
MLGIGRLKELIKAEKKKELEFHLNDILEIVILWKYIVALHIYICTLVLRYLKEPEDIGKVFKKLQTHDYDGSITLIKLYKRSLSILTSESLSKSTTNGLIREFSSIETVLDVGSVDKWFSNKKLSEVFLIILLSRFYSYDEQDDDDASFSPPSAFSPPPSSSSSSPPLRLLLLFHLPPPLLLLRLRFLLRLLLLRRLLLQIIMNVHRDNFLLYFFI